MIYLYILDYVHNNLTLELRLRVFVFLFQNATFIILYYVTSLFITAVIFWIYKPHQNIRTKRIAAFLQQATAFFYLHKAMQEKHLVGILQFHLTIVASSEFSIFIFKEIWRFVRYILFKFYSYLKDALKWTWNLFSSIMWKCVGVCNIILNLCTICLIVFLGMNFQALITCYDITSYLKDALKWTWNLFSSIMWKCVGVCNIILNLCTICLIVYLGMNFQALITCYDITKFTVVLSFQCLTICSRSVLRFI